MKKLVKECDWSALEFSEDPEQVDYTVYSHTLPNQKWELLGEGDTPNTYAVRIHQARGGIEVRDLTKEDLLEVPLGIIRKEEFRYELSPKDVDQVLRRLNGK